MDLSVCYGDSVVISSFEFETSNMELDRVLGVTVEEERRQAC